MCSNPPIKLVAVGKGKGVAHDGPQDRDQSHHGEALHHGAEDVLASHQAAVEQGQPGSGHQQHQRRGNQHPRVVGIHLCSVNCVLKRSEIGLACGGGGCRRLGGEQRRKQQENEWKKPDTNTGHAYSENGFTFLFMDTLTQPELHACC